MINGQIQSKKLSEQLQEYVTVCHLWRNRVWGQANPRLMGPRRFHLELSAETTTQCLKRLIFHFASILDKGFYDKVSCRLFFNVCYWLRYVVLTYNKCFPLDTHSNLNCSKAMWISNSDFAVIENSNPAFRAGRKNTHLSIGLSNSFIKIKYVQVRLLYFASVTTRMQINCFNIRVSRYYFGNTIPAPYHCVQVHIPHVAPKNKIYV